jgi:hypothetical protein
MGIDLPSPLSLKDDRLRISAAVALLALVLCISCTSVPQEVVELSVAVEERIVATQTSHEAFVSRYFDASRARIEDFLQYRWIPEFLADFVRSAELIDRLYNVEVLDSLETARLVAELKQVPIQRAHQDEVVGAVNRALGDSVRGDTVLLFAQAALDEIEAQRRELLTPFDQREATALAELRANYNELMSMQKTVSEFLKSVRETKELEESVLKRLRLQDERDQILKGAIEFNDKVANAIDRGESAADALEKLDEVLRSK